MGKLLAGHLLVRDTKILNYAPGFTALSVNEVFAGNEFSYPQPELDKCHSGMGLTTLISQDLGPAKTAE